MPFVRLVMGQPVVFVILSYVGDLYQQYHLRRVHMLYTPELHQTGKGHGMRGDKDTLSLDTARQYYGRISLFLKHHGGPDA
jgi:hypothetical protein